MSKKKHIKLLEEQLRIVEAEYNKYHDRAVYDGKLIESYRIDNENQVKRIKELERENRNLKDTLDLIAPNGAVALNVDKDTWHKWFVRSMNNND